VHFIVMNYATFPYDLQEMLTLIIIPIQVAQWIASCTSVSNRIRGLRVRSHQIPLLYIQIYFICILSSYSHSV